MLIRSLCLIGATALSLLAATAVAQRPGPPPPPTPEQAARRVERAVLRLELFDRVEHPTAVRRLEDAITVTRARIAMHQRQVAEYSRFDKVLYSKPLFLSLELAKLNLVAARVDLESLRREKLLLVQHRSQRRRLRQLEVDSAIHQQRRLERRLGSRPASKTAAAKSPSSKSRRTKRRRKPIIEARLR
ncbi:MAG: hypothetical protein IIA67_01055 [Planctomycetes bacterium]|nr:hypothetical protein [Planctomycetota bacterium]